MNATISLLSRLRAMNGIEDGGVLQQSIDGPDVREGGAIQIPTLERGVFTAASPMLAARFEFAGRWVNAAIGQTWLSVGDMKSFWESEKMMRQVELRRQNWQHSIIATQPNDRLSLFGIDTQDQEETYLIWSHLGTEPQIITFFEGQEDIYNNLEHFLYALTDTDIERNTSR